MHERSSRLEVWGGVECTVNRVNDRYHDQLRRNGHLERPEDLDRFASLGLRTLRVPVLWESLHDADGSYHFERVDPMLERARALGLRVIAGLVHHGSGPPHTSLLEPSFEHGVAHFAAAVSRRYPWIEDYTPINEPLTTARFSALYGHWYPHAHSARDFLRALLNQTRATVRAMQTIRSTVPHARLVQTEDIGSVTSTPLLAYQAEHENLRRWLSLDLLVGTVDAQHPLYRYVLDVGNVAPEELAWLVRERCPPDLIGINYYFTSDRYLDERLDQHPVWTHGGNGRHTYADIHSTAVPELGLRGHRVVIEEVWDRYHVPIALTEVHAGNAREEQLRWLDEAWRAASAARHAGVDVRAVTAWSLLGSFDWNTLVTLEQGCYEPGVYDLRAPVPRPTALADMVQTLAAGQHFDHPVLDDLGWWRRRCLREHPPRGKRRARPLVILGARGTLGSAFARACDARGLAYRALDHEHFDVTRTEHVERILAELSPWGVLNAAGYARVDDAEHERERCAQVNVEGSALLADACRERGMRLLTFSSDQIFDGAQNTPYLEHDQPRPMGVYGHSKVEAERRVLALCEDCLIVRSSAFFSPHNEADFVTRVVRTLRAGGQVRAARDVQISPTYVPHLVEAALDLLIDGERGVYHLANRGSTSWFELARSVARALRLREEQVLPCLLAELSLAAPRPRYSVLGSQRTTLMPSLEEGLLQYASCLAGR